MSNDNVIVSSNVILENARGSIPGREWRALMENTASAVRWQDLPLFAEFNEFKVDNKEKEDTEEKKDEDEKKDNEV
jgi:hypothetical protein